MSGEETLSLAARVTRRVNRRVRPVDDWDQYRTSEHWALPTRRGGDCEDIALLKKRELIGQGVDPTRLLIATVYSRRTGPHAVLVLRLPAGDFVLDNVTDQVKPWHGTRYTFLAMQDPGSKDAWVRVSGRR